MNVLRWDGGGQVARAFTSPSLENFALALSSPFYET